MAGWRWTQKSTRAISVILIIDFSVNIKAVDKESTINSGPLSELEDEVLERVRFFLLGVGGLGCSCMV